MATPASPRFSATCGHDHPPATRDPDASAPTFSGPNGTCVPPDLVFVLDRTFSMARSPDGLNQPATPEGRDQTKWALAVKTVHDVTAPPTDATIRFGVVLFPTDPGGDACVTLLQAGNGLIPANGSCAPADVAVPVALNQSAAITTAVDRDATRLCDSTPIGLALTTARDALHAVVEQNRPQYVVLVTDGGENCASNPAQVVAELAAQQIRTYIVGFAQLFDGGTPDYDVELLDDLACIGLTAPNEETACLRDKTGAYASARTHDKHLFYAAGSGDELSAALTKIAGDVCCGCTR